LSGVAGPSSFQRRLADALTRRGIGVAYGLGDEPLDAVLVIGGSRQLSGLWRARRRGVPIVQRLDGMNWIHRRRRTGWGHFLRAEANNLLLRFVRSRLADTVVYQSDFVRGWWERRHGAAPGRSDVIRNGVPLEIYSPKGAAREKADGLRLIVLEGAIGGGYEIGLEWAAELAQGLAEAEGKSVELMVAGRLPKLPGSFKLPGSSLLLGELPPDSVPALLRSGDLLFSADIHPACPNSVIEALACGLPVIGFETGALREIVDADSGAVVPYGGDSWKLGPPDLPALVRAAQAILDGGDRFRRGARRRAEAAFSLDRMVDDYLAVLGWA
jgi:glycosyltransferase involved in cell wall biosynthesis